MDNLGIKLRWIAAIADVLGGLDSLAVAERFVHRLPPGYIESTSYVDAAFDAVQLAAYEANISDISSEDPIENDQELKVHNEADNSVFVPSHRFVVGPQEVGPSNSIRLRRYSYSAIELSGLVRVLESFGFVVTEILPTLFLPGTPDGNPVHLDDIGLRWVGQTTMGVCFDPQSDGERLVDALNSVDDGYSEVDLLNRLILAAGLRWRQVVLLRAYRSYRRQISARYTDTELDDAFFAFPSVTSALVTYFEAKFDPTLPSRVEVMSSLRSRALAELNSISDFSHDQILRGYLELIDATTRTNYYLRNSNGQPRPTLVLKFSSSKGSEQILTHPLREVFVYSPNMEGVHLRSGLISRGGIRWSDRTDDFRTEILGLAQAQIKKNAIIVPTGAKGGFIVRNKTNPGVDEVAAAYKTFIRSLLEVSDNLVESHTVTPDGIVAFDEDDFYLVVAADKGTATFSDIANDISRERNFWLGDAFASGGTHGYDHKAMRITARGAWIAALRHFKQLDIDAQNDTIKVVGVGDMSGDVFGNGMLQSRSIALVAAFDHNNIFIDPDPDLVVSFGERERLATLGRSSWTDYDTGAISTGGGVWSRDLKEIQLHPRARALLGIDKEFVKPLEVISAILEASVDLIWFGGIGTYLKDRDESDAEIGDSANDLVRVSADRVRARVIVEGANLAVTQRARIRYSRRGGKINTDFIDNAAGVAISDREVNLKVLLDLAIKEHLLDSADRNSILSEVANEVAQEVLKQVDRSINAITNAVLTSVGELDAFEALVDSLEKAQRLDRKAESLPSIEEFAKRREAGAGLVRPELAVLLAYAKSELTAAIEKESLAVDPTASDLALSYFPSSIAQRFSDLITRHPLYRQLVATSLAGEIVDQMGIVWANETSAEFNCTLAEVAVAFWVSWQVLDGHALRKQAEELGLSLPATAETRLDKAIMDLVNELTRMYLSNFETITPGRLITRDKQLIASTTDFGCWNKSARVSENDLTKLLEDTVEIPKVVNRFLMTLTVPLIVEAGRVSRQSGQPIENVLSAFECIDSEAGMDAISSLLESVSSHGRWISWQIRGIRDDLVRWRTDICLKVLTANPSVGPKEAVRTWQVLHSRTLEQVQDILERAPKYPGEEATIVSLVLRLLRSTA